MYNYLQVLENENACRKVSVNKTKNYGLKEPIDNQKISFSGRIDDKQRWCNGMEYKSAVCVCVCVYCLFITANRI